MRRLVPPLALLALVACATPGAGPRALPPGAPGDGRETLLRFARAAEQGRWAEAWPLLSERWRSLTSPGRLAADYRGAGPLAREAAQRVAALLEGGAALGEGPAGQLRLPVGPGRAARLVREGAAWRVDALE